MSTFEKIYSAKMWLMSTFENENLKIIFFVSTFLDWYIFFVSTFLDWYNRAEKNRKNVIFGIGFTQKNVQTIL